MEVRLRRQQDNHHYKTGLPGDDDSTRLIHIQSAGSNGRLPSLFLISNSTSLSLIPFDFPKVNPNCACSKRVRIRPSTVFLVSCSKASDQRVQRSPSLFVRTSARRCWVGVAEEKHVVTWTLVFPNWSRYLRNSSTCDPLHSVSVRGGLWFLRYCRNVFQSRRFCDS